MKNRVRIIIYNILIFIVFIMLIELASSLYLDNSKFFASPVEIKNLQNKVALQTNDHSDNWANIYTEEVKKLKTEYRSYFGWRRMPYDGVTIQIDSQGIRNTIQETQKSDSIPIAIFLGGSTMWGTGVSNESTIPSIFSRKSNKKFKIANFGEAGYNAYQSFQFFQLKIIEGTKPQLVISYDGVNNSPVRAKYFAHAREKQISDKLKETYFLKSTRIVISKIKRRLYSPKKNSLKNILHFSEERNRKAAIELLESWLLIRQTCKLLGADFICVLQPNAFVGSPNTKNIENELEFHPYSDSYEYYDDVLNLLKTNRFSVLKEHFLDLSKIFDAHPNIFIDWCHASPMGNEKIVDSLVNHLQKIN